MAKAHGITAIPELSIMLIVKATVTSTSLATVTNTATQTASAQHGYSAAVLGGTVAGIAVGLIVLGAVLYVIMSKRSYRREVYDRAEGPVVRGKQEKAGELADIPGGRVSTIY